jgi:hypothetical protein
MENTFSTSLMVEFPALPYENPFSEIIFAPRIWRSQITAADKSEGKYRQMNAHGCVIRSIAITLNRTIFESVVSSREVASEPMTTPFHWRGSEDSFWCTPDMLERAAKDCKTLSIDEIIRNMI